MMFREKVIDLQTIKKWSKFHRLNLQAIKPILSDQVTIIIKQLI